MKNNKKITAKIIGAWFFMMLASSSWAVDNSIYIDQSGDNANVTISQDGAGNRVKGITSAGQPGQSTDAAKIYGDGVQVAISQVGAGNQLSLGINSVIASAMAPTSVTYNVTGGNNIGFIDLNNAGVSGGNASSLVNITQTDGGNHSRISMLGSGNSLTAVQNGGNSSLMSIVNANGTTQNISTNGTGGDSISTSLTGNNGTVNITSTNGGTNTITVSQDNAGGTHATTVSLNGAGNTVGITQAGSADTTVNLVSRGAGNTFSISTNSR
jgi:hypothetical protein